MLPLSFNFGLGLRSGHRPPLEGTRHKLIPTCGWMSRRRENAVPVPIRMAKVPRQRIVPNLIRTRRGRFGLLGIRSVVPLTLRCGYRRDCPRRHPGCSKDVHTLNSPPKSSSVSPLRYHDQTDTKQLIVNSPARTRFPPLPRGPMGARRVCSEAPSSFARSRIARVFNCVAIEHTSQRLRRAQMDEGNDAADCASAPECRE